MKNKNVGYLIVGIAVLIVAIVLIFNTALEDIIDTTCDHGTTCQMYDTLSVQTNLSLAIAGLILVIGIFLIFAKEEKEIIIQKVRVRVREKKKKIDTSKLSSDEKALVKILQREKGATFQKSIAEEMDIGKVKMTRLLDKLESKLTVERKRRGMNNIVVLIK
jgi:uncharacterized membrane protein